jgi:RNA polymerase sigma-70 factor, ECF subfamily
MIIRDPSLHSLGVATGSTLGAFTVRAADPPAVAGQHPTFREVFDRHARYAWRSLLGLGVQAADLPDASQQVFLVVHARLEADQIPAGAVRTFVYGVCLRVASDMRRRAHRRREQLCAIPPEPAFAATQERSVALGEALGLLEGALDRLPLPQREAFVLYEIEELEMTEVAAALGCPLQTAYSRLHAARKIVVAALGGAMDDEAPRRDAGRTR